MSYATLVTKFSSNWRCPLSNSNKYFSICFKLWDNVYGHNISAKFDNELYRKRRSRVMPPYLRKFHEIDDVRSLTQIFFDLHQTGIMFMGIISRPSLIMSYIGKGVQELCPLFVKISRNWRCPLCNSNKYFSICIKLWNNVYGHNISTKFDNEQYRMSRSSVMSP